MKKILSALLLLTLTMVFACKDKDKGYVFPYTGHWAGTYSGIDNGTWNADITYDGVFSGTANSTLYPSYSLNITGTVDNQGKITAGYNYLNYSASFNGQISGTNVSGTWIIDSVNVGGTWTGTKQ